MSKTGRRSRPDKRFTSRLLPELADDVIVGILPLNDAYEKAKARKEGKDTDEARMAELRSAALARLRVGCGSLGIHGVGWGERDAAPASVPVVEVSAAA
jgi:hypothetical protein